MNTRLKTMPQDLSRRNLIRWAGAGAFGLAASSPLVSQQPPEPNIQLPPTPIVPIGRRSTVYLLKGENRRQNVHDALMGIDHEVRPALKRKKYVLIKPNLTSFTNQLAATHVDAIRGILDYLAPRFKGPVVIAESAGGNAQRGYDNFKYTTLAKEFPSLKVSLVDFDEEALFVPLGIITYDVHPQMIRVAKRLFDPDVFVISSCIQKTHDGVVMTAAVKNMAMGGILRSGKKETTKWTDKQKMHVGAHQMNYNLMLVASKMAPHWGAAVVDGYEGMEGQGPTAGTPVPHRIAVASTDFVAADRVATELMGIDPKWVGYLQYCEEFGIGNYDIGKIDVRGETIASLKRTYRLNSSTERSLQWMGPMGPDPALGRGERRPGAPPVPANPNPRS